MTINCIKIITVFNETRLCFNKIVFSSFAYEKIFGLQIGGISELGKLQSILTGKYLIGLLKCKSLIDSSQTQAMCVLSRKKGFTE